MIDNSKKWMTWQEFVSMLDRLPDHDFRVYIPKRRANDDSTLYQVIDLTDAEPPHVEMGMSDTLWMIGKRVDGSMPSRLGEYSKINGVWWIKVPAPGFSSARIENHEVAEHEDGTITVSPSILMAGTDGKTWHGYLERGIWRRV